MSAYTAKRNIKASTHAGLKATFNKELVKSGRVSRADGKLYNQLFGLRQRADYEDFVEMTAEQIAPLIPKIRLLIQLIDNIVAE